MNACSTHKPAPPLNSNLPFCQLLNERNISFEKIVIQHFLPRRPPDITENSILDFARIALHHVEVQLNGRAIVVMMADGSHLWPNRGANPSSSSSSRRSASSGRSSGSTLPPGN